MAAPKFKIEYIDGETEEVSLRPARQMQYESESGEPLFAEDEAILMTKVYTLAWYAAGKPDTIEEWVELLESVEMVNEDTDDELPTQAEG